MICRLIVILFACTLSFSPIFASSIWWCCSRSADVYPSTINEHYALKPIASAAHVHEQSANLSVNTFENGSPKGREPMLRTDSSVQVSRKEDASTKCMSLNCTVYSSGFDEFDTNLKKHLDSILNSLNQFETRAVHVSPECQNYLKDAFLALSEMSNSRDNKYIFDRFQNNTLIPSGYCFSVQELICDIFRVMSYKKAGKEISLEYSLKDSFPKKVVADRALIQHVIMNLLSNALKFTNAGLISINGTFERNDQRSDTLTFQVKDTGKGISSEEIEKLFQPYTQANDSIESHYGGTGLGLWFSKRLCELMGGSMGVSSIPNEGSTFWFTVQCNCPETTASKTEIITPRLVVEHKRVDTTALYAHELRNLSMAMLFQLEMLSVSACIENQRTVDINSAQENAQKIVDLLNSKLGAAKALHLQGESKVEQRYEAPKDINILVVDDSMMARRITEHMLKQLNFTNIVLLSTGAEAVAAASKNHYDIILMDKNMPEMDGVETSENIIQNSVLNMHTPIIVLSGDEMTENNEKLFSAFLLKPVNNCALSAVINSVLGTKKNVKNQHSINQLT